MQNHSNERKKDTSGKMLYILDTHAWVEYFLGSEKGKIVRKLLSVESDDFITLESTLAELKLWASREQQEFSKIYSLVKTNSHIESISLEDWLDAAEVRIELRKKMPDFGLIDALVVSRQKKHKCKAVSGDPHFKSLSNVVFLVD